MPWTRLDDGFCTHPKVAELSHIAFRLHVFGLNWSVGKEQDGKVSPVVLPSALPYDRPKQREAAVAELEEAGLWIRNGRGWVIHDFGDYQETKEQVRARRQKWAAQKRGQRSGVHRGQDAESGDTQPNPSQPNPKEIYLDPQRGLTLAIEEAAKDPLVRNPKRVGRYRFERDPVKYNAQVDLLQTTFPETLKPLPPPEDLKAKAKRLKDELQRRENA